MPAGTPNYFNTSRGKNAVEQASAKTRSETKVAKTISFLDEGESIGYSFLIQPVKTSFKKFSSDLKSIIGAGNQQGAKTADQTSKDLTEAQKKAQDVQSQNKVNNFLRTSEFTAKLITAESIKSSAYICLPLPTQIPRDQLSVSYSVDDLGTAIAGYSLGSEAADRVANGGSLSDLASAGGSYVIRSLLQTIAPKGVATAFFGNVPNPFSANIFENVETRTFTFDWVLQPKSYEESEKIREIVNQLRYYALPEPNGLLLELPHEFNLAFVGTNFLYAFSRCVLTNIETNYAPNGFNVFTVADAPQSIALTLTFKEIFPLNKEVIMNFNQDSMTPRQIMQETSTNSQSDASVETAVSNTQASVEKEITQQVDDWKAKRAELLKLEQERDTILRSKDQDQNRLANVNARITQTKISMNLIATEVQTLQAKINYTDRTGRKLKPLPFV